MSQVRYLSILIIPSLLFFNETISSLVLPITSNEVLSKIFILKEIKSKPRRQKYNCEFNDLVVSRQSFHSVWENSERLERKGPIY